MMPPMLQLSWVCKACGREGGFGYDYDTTVLSLIRVAQSTHAAFSPDCSDKHSGRVPADTHSPGSNSTLVFRLSGTIEETKTENKT